MNLEAEARAPDLVIMGSHDLALDVVVGALAERGFKTRIFAVGSLGGAAAVSRGQCDLAPVHLVDPSTGLYNRHLLAPGVTLVSGWHRMQGSSANATTPGLLRSALAQRSRPHWPIPPP